jgi:hypothetical protein
MDVKILNIYINGAWKSIKKQIKNKFRGFLVRKRTIPTEQPPLVGEVSANISG